MKSYKPIKEKYESPLEEITRFTGKFSKDTDIWYDDLCRLSESYFKDKKFSSTMKIFIKYAKQIEKRQVRPTIINFDTFSQAVLSLPKLKELISFRDFLQFVDKTTYKREFRNFEGKVSVISEIFSLFRQAVLYYEDFEGLMDEKLSDIGVNPEYIDAVKQCMEENNFEIKDLERGAVSLPLTAEHGQGVVIANKTWVFMTDKEADFSCRESVLDTIDDMGVQNIDDWENYVNKKKAKEFFEGYFTDSVYTYVEDIVNEDSDTYSNRLIEEMVENDIIDEETAMDPDYDYHNDIEDFVSNMVEEKISFDDCGLESFKLDFGEEEMVEILEKNNLIDIDALVEYIIGTDGRGHTLASHDGEEHEHKNIYYYREN